MIAALGAMLAVTLAADGAALDYRASLRASSGLRTIPSGGDQLAVGELDLAPRLEGLLDAPRLRGSLRYEPELRATLPLGGGDQWAITHGLYGGAQLDLAPLWRLDGEVHERFGTVDLLSPSAAPTPVQTLPAVTVLPFQDGTATGELRGQLGRRSAAGARLRLSAYGGLGARGRALVPLQREAAPGVFVEWDVAPLDQVRGDAGLVLADVVDVSRVRLADGRATWTHRVSPELSLHAAGGAALADVSGNVAGSGRRTMPIAELGAHYAGGAAPGRLEVIAAVRMRPLIDRIAGALEERAELESELIVRPSGAWTLAARTDGAIVTEPQRAELAKLEVRLARETAGGTTFFGGLWGQWQHDARVSPGPLLYWGATVGFELLAAASRGARRSPAEAP